MSNGIFSAPLAKNEPIKNYGPGSIEKGLLKQALDDICSKTFDIPLIIGGKEIRTKNTAELKSPSDHSKCFGQYHKASAEHVNMAVKAAAEAKEAWSSLPWNAFKVLAYSFKDYWATFLSLTNNI